MSIVNDKSTEDISEVTCDREGCSNRGEPNENWMAVEYFNKETSVMRARKDLCPDCAGDLIGFFGGED